MNESQVNQVIAELRAESKIKKLVTRQSVEVLELWADRLERALASSPSQPWISVKDRLPTEHGTYLVAYSEAVGRRFVSDDRWDGNWWIDTHTGTVDHWMPLPAAPALGEGER